MPRDYLVNSICEHPAAETGHKAQPALFIVQKFQISRGGEAKRAAAVSCHSIKWRRVQVDPRGLAAPLPGKGDRPVWVEPRIH